MSRVHHAPIPLAKPFLGAEEEAAVLRAMRSGRLVQGPEIAAFEEELAESCGRRWAVAVSSGTAALHLGLWALGVGPGQTIRVPAFTFPATANVVRLLGAEVELVDVNPASWCMRLPDQLEGRRRSLTVHQFGFPARVFDGDISDAACAAGVRAAMQGACACLSFHPRKVLTTGEGGAIVGDDEGLLGELRRLRSHGLVPRQGTAFVEYDVSRPATNYRLSEPQAAMGRAQLARLPAFLDERRALVARYRARLAGAPLGLQSDTPSRSWQTFAVQLPQSNSRDAIRRTLAESGIETQVASYGLHTLTPYLAPAADYPVADALHRRAMALPLWNGMPESDVDRVADALLAALDVG